MVQSFCRCFNLSRRTLLVDFEYKEEPVVISGCLVTRYAYFNLYHQSLDIIEWPISVMSAVGQVSPVR